MKETTALGIVIVLSLIGLFIMAAIADNHRMNSIQYKNLLIEFNHARYVIDAKTGKSEFVVDKP